MNIKQNPFSLYDFLGYFVPGAIFLYGVFLIDAHQRTVLTMESATAALTFEKIPLYLPFVLIAYVIGHILSYLSSITVEKYAIWTHDYPSQFLLGLECHGYWNTDTKREKFVRSLVGLLLLPIPLLDNTIGRALYLRKTFARGLDTTLATCIQERTQHLMHTHHGQACDLHRDHDFFRLVYHYAVEHAPNHFPKLQNYVALFGLLRTLCLICVLAFWVSLLHLVPSTINSLTYVSLEALVVSLISLMLLTYLFYMAFMKFYRRFSLEAFMALTVAGAVHRGSPNSAESK